MVHGVWAVLLMKKKTYNSLTDLRDELVRDGVEILSFNGFSLETKTHDYGLYSSIVYRKSKKDGTVETSSEPGEGYGIYH